MFYRNIVSVDGLFPLALALLLFHLLISSTVKIPFGLLYTGLLTFGLLYTGLLKDPGVSEAF